MAYVKLIGSNTGNQFLKENRLGIMNLHFITNSTAMVSTCL